MGVRWEDAMPRGRTPPRREPHQAEDGFLEPPPIARAIGDAILRAWDRVEAAESPATCRRPRPRSTRRGRRLERRRA